MKLNNQTLNKIEREIKNDNQNNSIKQFILPDTTIDYQALRKKIIDNIPKLIDKKYPNESNNNKIIIKKYLEDNIFKIKDIIKEDLHNSYLESLNQMVDLLLKSYRNNSI